MSGEKIDGGGGPISRHFAGKGAVGRGAESSARRQDVEMTGVGRSALDSHDRDPLAAAAGSAAHRRRVVTAFVDGEAAFAAGVGLGRERG